MKTQKFFHLTFKYDFPYSWGRNVIEDFLRVKFSVFIDDGGLPKPGGLRLADMFRRQHPNIDTIRVARMNNEPAHTADGLINWDHYVIVSARIDFTLKADKNNYE